jgi:hypothetical protein
MKQKEQHAKKNNAQLLDLPMHPVPCDRNKQDRCQTRHRHIPVVGLMDKSQASQWWLATLAAHLLDAQPHQPTRARPLWLAAPTDIPKVGRQSRWQC